MKQATLYDLLQSDAKSTYSNWCGTLRLLREITDPSARKMFEQELGDLHSRAYELRATDQLTSMSLSMMNIILSRTAEQWCVLNRHPNSPLISTH